MTWSASTRLTLLSATPGKPDVGVVLDTSALIALERLGGAPPPERFPWDEQVVIPAIVWAEALIGVRLADSALRASQRRARLETLRRVTGIEPFTPDMAECYADIFAELSNVGKMIPQNDIAVAATARALGFSVLVGPSDEVHFRRVAALDAISVGLILAFAGGEPSCRSGLIVPFT